MPVLTKINTNSIAEDAITGDKFAGDAYLANTANQNISGTYSENRLYTSDAYTLSGNATVNSHLTLSSIKPTADVVLTASGAYTITGTGVLSAGSLLAKERTDLTGMTGEIGSVVTGAPALTGLGTVTSGTLGSGVTFPAGHVIKKTVFHNSDLVTVASNTTGYELFTITFTAQETNSAYYFSGTFASANATTSSSDAGDRCYIAWLSDSESNKYYFGYRRTSTRYSNAQGSSYANADHYFLCEGDGGYYMNSGWNQSFYTFVDISGNQSAFDTTTVVPSVYTAGETITLHVWGASANGFYYNQASSTGSSSSNAYSHFCITEIAG